jgi:hypothetical protein
MVAEDPEVARPADRLRGRLRDFVLGAGWLALAVGLRQQPLQLGRVEPDQVEVEALVPQPSQLLGQQGVVPARLQGQLVVGDQVSALAIEAAIWSTCASLWVRGLRSYGRRRSIGHSSIRSASATSCSAAAIFTVSVMAPVWVWCSSRQPAQTGR